MIKLIEKEIPAGWTAFCKADEDKVVGYREFKNGGKAKTVLELISAASEEALLAELEELGYTLPEQQ